MSSPIATSCESYHDLLNIDLTFSVRRHQHQRNLLKHLL